jgi:hypothetical protein
MRIHAMRRIVTLSVLGLLVAAGAQRVIVVPAWAFQAQATPTPAPLDFPSVSPSPAGGAPPTPSRTPTPPGPAFAEPIDEANVRSGPGIDFDRLGTIYNGDEYVVIGAHREYPWYQIEFADSPTGTAWVYRDLVVLSGNVQNVPLIEGPMIPTEDPAVVSAQQTLAALEQTPGALATATALAGLLPTGVFAEGAGADTGLVTHPPTFTPPPLGPTQPPAQGSARRSEDEAGIAGVPPAVPIIALLVLGVLGLIVSLARRLF